MRSIPLAFVKDSIFVFVSKVVNALRRVYAILFFNEAPRATSVMQLGQFEF